jgi:hypothetical protein
MNISIDSNTAVVLIIACLCLYWSVNAWANRDKS